jgi:hypothetical protein
MRIGAPSPLTERKCGLGCVGRATCDLREATRRTNKALTCGGSLPAEGLVAHSSAAGRTCWQITCSALTANGRAAQASGCGVQLRLHGRGAQAALALHVKHGACSSRA